MTDTVKTLDELNANPYDWDWDKYTLRCGYSVGAVGRHGGATHLQRIETVIEDRDPKAGTYKVGDIFSARALCNGNGQHTGRSYARLDTKDITCQKCLKALASL